MFCLLYQLVDGSYWIVKMSDNIETLKEHATRHFSSGDKYHIMQSFGESVERLVLAIDVKAALLIKK